LPWTTISDKAYGELKVASVERGSPSYVNIFDGTIFFYEYDGYHYFDTDEETCVMGASFSCVDPDLCNTIAPWTEAN